MRALKIVCGIAVLVVALHMVHGIHHFVSHNTSGWGAGMLTLLAFGVVVDVFAFVGGVLLLTRG